MLSTGGTFLGTINRSLGDVEEEIKPVIGTSAWTVWLPLVGTAAWPSCERAWVGGRWWVSQDHR